VFICVLIVFSVNCVFYVFLQYFDTVGWVLTWKNCHPYNLYCVDGDVKPCSINQLDILLTRTTDNRSKTISSPTTGIMFNHNTKPSV